MKIALVGTGRMGQAVKTVAEARRHEVVVQFDEHRPVLDASVDDLGGAEVIIDFSLPHLAVDHIKRYTDWNVPAVIGTTGWYDRLDEVRNYVLDGGGRVLYGANFSLGVALLSRAVKAVLPLLNELEHFDAFVHEVHHTNKVDSPSGTAVMLGNLIVDGLDRKSTFETNAVQGRIDAEALHVSSTRTGSVFGRHTVGFESDVDELTFEHRAKSREGFALGAVRAAEWMIDQHGFYSLDDALDQWVNRT